MSAPAVISASLVDVRNVSAHKCVRLEIHVPVEQAGLVMAAFGWPTAVDPVPVAIARLDLSKPASDPEKTRRPFETLLPAQQAAMRCNEVGFQKFVSAQTPEGAATQIRIRCGVVSRSDLNTDPIASQKWRALDTEYFRESRGIR
jgi:hypothetical protein